MAVCSATRGPSPQLVRSAIVSSCGSRPRIDGEPQWRHPRGIPTTGTLVLLSLVFLCESHSARGTLGSEELRPCRWTGSWDSLTRSPWGHAGNKAVMEARGQRHGVIPQPDPCAAAAQDPFPSLPTAADLGSTQGQGRPSAKDSIQGSASGRLGGPCSCVGLLSESSALSQGSAPPLSEVAGPSGCLVCERCYTLTDPGTPSSQGWDSASALRPRFQARSGPQPPSQELPGCR